MQRCGVCYKTHESEGEGVVTDSDIIGLFKELFDNDEGAFNSFKAIIKNHHHPKNKIEEIVQSADHLSACERVSDSDEDIKAEAEWTARIKPQQLMESQIIEEYDDGTMDLSITVNSLSEIASWIVSRGEHVKVLEPPELKERVLELARGTLRNYE